MELRLLGGLSISRYSTPITGFVSSKAPALVAYLAATGDSHTRDALAGLLWSDVPEKDARASLRVVLSNLRQTLGQDQLVIDRQRVALAADALARSDLGEFLQLVSSHSASALSRACDLYVGEFLADFVVRDAPLFEEWLVTERERIRTLAIETFERFAAMHAASGSHAAAADTLERLLEIEPWYEAALRNYLEQLALAGRHRSALVRFDAFSQLLDRELGAAPEAETIALYEQIRDGEIDAQEPAQHQQISAPVRQSAQLRPPSPVTSFIGRDEELAQLAEYLGDPSVRLISLIGPGGAGKTRLALRTVEDLGHRFDLGAHVAMLAEITDPDQLLPAIADALGISLEPTPDPLLQIQRHLVDNSVLLLLDNFEQLLEGATYVRDLLDAVPGITVLVTTRARLALQAEWTVPVSGLPVAEAGDSTTSSSAVRLFIDRARQQQPDLLPDTSEIYQIIHICRQVEGSPLGIELAASWIRLMSCEEIADRIRENLDFLATTFRDVPERHRSLRAVFNASWSLLDQAEREKFRALSIFSGGFTADAARATARAELPELLDLSDKSLVRRDATGRFSLHEVLRQFAADRLADDPDELEATSDRHASYYARLLARAYEPLTGTGQAETLKELDAERSNLRVAWGWMVRRKQFDLIGTALNGIVLFFALRRLATPGHRMMDEAEAALRAQPGGDADTEILLGRLLGKQARFMLMLGRAELAGAYLAEARRLLARHEAQDQLTYGLEIEGRVADLRGDIHRARQLYQLALEEAEQRGDRYAMSNALNRLAGIAFNNGDFHAARGFFSRSLENRRANQDWEGAARELGNLGEVACETGDYEQAVAYMEESLAIFREIGIDTPPGRLEGLGRLALRQGDLNEAERRLAQAEQIDRDQGGRITGTIALLRRAEVALLRDDLETARQLLLACRERIDADGFRSWIAQWGVLRSQLALAQHLPHEAVEHARESIAQAEDLGDVVVRARAVGMLARARLVLGCVEDALIDFQDAIRSVEGSGTTPVILDLTASLVCAQLATLDDRTDVSSDANYTQLVAHLLFLQTQPQIWYSTKLDIERSLSEMAGAFDAQTLSTARDSAARLTLEVILSRMR